jgi:hypothetical protein
MPPPDEWLDTAALLDTAVSLTTTLTEWYDCRNVGTGWHSCTCCTSLGMENDMPPPLPLHVLPVTVEEDTDTTASRTCTTDPRLSNCTAMPPPEPPDNQ